jgi:hypothetical protein
MAYPLQAVLFTTIAGSMSQEFRLAPPPTNLLSPLVELRDYYVQLVREYEIKLELARAQLSHVEALLCGWDEVAAPSPSSLPGVHAFV